MSRNSYLRAGTLSTKTANSRSLLRTSSSDYPRKIRAKSLLSTCVLRETASRNLSYPTRFGRAGANRTILMGPPPPPPPPPARPSLFLLVRNHGGHENVAPLTIDDLVCAFDIAYPTLVGHRRGLQICAPQAVHDIIPRGAPGRRRRRRLPPGRPFQYMRQARDERRRLLRPDLIPSPSQYRMGCPMTMEPVPGKSY